MVILPGILFLGNFHERPDFQHGGTSRHPLPSLCSTGPPPHPRATLSAKHHALRGVPAQYNSCLSRSFFPAWMPWNGVSTVLIPPRKGSDLKGVVQFLPRGSCFLRNRICHCSSYSLRASSYPFPRRSVCLMCQEQMRSISKGP